MAVKLNNLIQATAPGTVNFDVNQPLDAASDGESSGITQSISSDSLPSLDELDLATAGNPVEFEDASIPADFDSEISEKDISRSNNLDDDSNSALASDPSVESTSLTTGHDKLWDYRFGNGFSESRQIGNNMPKGEEFKGSPSLMNSMTLIRFSHIAGSNHHKNLIDMAGQPGFSGVGRQYISASASATDSDVKDLNVVSTDNSGVSKLDSSSMPSNLKQYEGKSVFKSETGALFTKSEDRTIEIWENSTGEKKTIDTSTTSSRPNSEEYWVKELGYVKGYRGEYYENNKLAQASIDTNSGTGAKSQSSVELTTAEKAKIANNSAPGTLQSKLNSGWKITGYGEKSEQLRRMSSAPTVTKTMEPTFENLCDSANWQTDPQFKYNWRDFLYTEQYGFIPNNRMVTLRRFPMPVIDSGKVIGQNGNEKHQIPIATAINWWGESTNMNLSDLMSFNFALNWDDMDAEERQDTLEEQGNEHGAGDGMMGKIAKSLFTVSVATGGAGIDTLSGKNEQIAGDWDKFDPYKSGKYINKIFGPVNRITKTKVRKAGMKFEQTITVNFHYILKSMGGVNPKAAMLDVMANMLALTYADADFWGGDLRYFPQHPQYPFQGGRAGQEAWFNAEPEKYIKALATSFTTSIKNIGESIANMMKDPVEGLKQLASGIAKVWMAKKISSRPRLIGMKSLLSGAPIGEWHLTIGNPFNPIAMIGNLVVTDVNMSFSDSLGADDFPDKMTVAITLEHGLPRGKGDIESIFNRGAGKLHYAYEGQASEAWNESTSSTDGSDRLGKKPGSQINAHTGKRESVYSSGTGFGQDYQDEMKISNDDTVKSMVRRDSELSGFYKKAHDLSERVSIKNMNE